MDTLWPLWQCDTSDTGWYRAQHCRGWMVGFNGFHLWIPFLGSTSQNVAETWGFSYIAATLTGLPQLMDVPNVLRCFGLLLIGLRRASSNSNGNSLRQILPIVFQWVGRQRVFQQIDTWRNWSMVWTAAIGNLALNSHEQPSPSCRLPAAWSWMNLGWTWSSKMF